MPLPSFMLPLSLPPPVPCSLHLHVIHPSSPFAHPIIKSFSCCFAKCHVNLSHAPLPPRSSSPSRLLFQSHSFSIFPMSRLEEMCRRQEGVAIYGHGDSIEIHSAGIYVLASTKCQFNTLLDILGPLLWGHRTKVVATDSIFLHYRDLTSFCVWNRQRISRRFILCHVITDSWIGTVALM